MSEMLNITSAAAALKVPRHRVWGAIRELNAKQVIKPPIRLLGTQYAFEARLLPAIEKTMAERAQRKGRGRPRHG